MPARAPASEIPPASQSGRDSLSSRLVRVGAVGAILLLAWLICFFIFPRVETLFRGLGYDDNANAPWNLVYASRNGFKTLALSAVIIALWVLLRKKGRAATHILAALLLFLLLETGVIIYVVLFTPVGGLSNSIK